MEKINSTIVALQLSNRDMSAPDVQEVLTEYGDNIKTRLGLRTDDASQGLIVLQFNGDSTALNNFKQDLDQLNNQVNYDSLQPDFT